MNTNTGATTFSVAAPSLYKCVPCQC